MPMVNPQKRPVPNCDEFLVLEGVMLVFFEPSNKDVGNLESLAHTLNHVTHTVKRMSKAIDESVGFFEGSVE